MAGVSLQLSHGVLFCMNPQHSWVGEGSGQRCWTSACKSKDWGSFGHRWRQWMQQWVQLISRSGDATHSLGEQMLLQILLCCCSSSSSLSSSNVLSNFSKFSLPDQNAELQKRTCPTINYKCLSVTREIPICPSGQQMVGSSSQTLLNCISSRKLFL